MSKGSVLVVTGDTRARETAGAVLRRLAIEVHEADTGATAIAAIRARSFDLALIDFRLPDISGLDIILALKKERGAVPWLLMSEWMTTPLAVEAMKRGAIDAVELPFDVENVVVSALSRVLKGERTRWPRVPPASVLPTPRSAAERWACLVLRGCAAEHDLKTISAWASVAGTSYSALTESCRLVGIRPHDARDFLRIFGALCRVSGRTEHLEHGLDVSDHRTLKSLLERAGLAVRRTTGVISLREFVDRQQFVDPACEPVRFMLKMIAPLDDD
jgi:ActR/RegA family two-component response regulator